MSRAEIMLNNEISKSNIKKKKNLKKNHIMIWWDLKTISYYAVMFTQNLFETTPSTAVQQKISSLHIGSQLTHESSLHYWFAYDWFMFISKQLGQGIWPCSVTLAVPTSRDFSPILAFSDRLCARPPLIRGLEAAQAFKHISSNCLLNWK